MSNKIYRGWINQPSTLQDLHELHGKKCIVEDRGDASVRIWFTEGPVHSMMCLRGAVEREQISKAG